MTRVYGSSDDLIEFEGDFESELAYYGDDDKKDGSLVVMSDGTVLEIRYGKSDLGIWSITLLKQGPLFSRIEVCADEDSGLYSDVAHSDVAHFTQGIEWAFAASEWVFVS